MAIVNHLIQSGSWRLPIPNPRHRHAQQLLNWTQNFTPMQFDLTKTDTILWLDTPLQKIKTDHIWDAIRFKLPEIPWHDLV